MAARKKSKDATIADVAARAGVSLSTVSYVFSGARPIKPETKERIELAVRELGYQPNIHARSLASKKSHVLVLLYPGLNAPLGATLSGIVQAATLRAKRDGYTLVLWPIDPHDAGEVLDRMRQGMADGVIVMEVGMDDERIDMLETAEIPYVMIGRTRKPNRPSVDIDFAGAVADGIEYLFAQGHRKIGFLNNEVVEGGYAPPIRALEAYRNEMEKRHQQPHFYMREESALAGRYLARHLLDDRTDLTAFLTMNEMATVGFMSEMRAINVRIPAEMSVVSLVTSPTVAQMNSPTLTFSQLPHAALGTLAVENLLHQLEKDSSQAEEVLVSCPMVQGLTVGPPRPGQLGMSPTAITR